MKRRIRYVILITVVISIILYTLITKTTYPSDQASIDECMNTLDISYTEKDGDLYLEHEGATLEFVIYGDSLYEAKAYLPLAGMLCEELGANVRVLSYNFLGNMNVVLDDPSDAIIITHGNGSEWLRFVSSKAKAVIILGNTGENFKFEATHVGVIRGGLDLVSSYSNEVLPQGSIIYKIDKANFSNYAYAQMHANDAPSLLKREEQIRLAINYIDDFVSSLVD